MRRILRKVCADKSDELGDTSTLADPSIVDVIIENHEKLTKKKWGGDEKWRNWMICMCGGSVGILQVALLGGLAWMVAGMDMSRFWWNLGDMNKDWNKRDHYPFAFSLKHKNMSTLFN